MKKSYKNCIAIIVIAVVTILAGCKKDKVPVVATAAVSNIVATTATGGGSITDEGSSTVITRGVCWSTGLRPSIADNKTTDGAGAGSFTSNITGLNGATTYYVRAYATNSAGTGYGMAMSFTTLGQAPTPATAAATNITVTDATLNGSVNANYLSTVVTFEYGTTTSYGSNAIFTQNPVTGNTITNVSLDITGLTAGTIYHYRIKAVNSLGTTYGSDLTFTTLGQIPTVATLAATNVNVSGATLNGSVNANYLSTVVTFEYGTTTNYGSITTATQSPVSGSTITNVSAIGTGLNPGTIYHCRIKAINSLGTAYGSDRTFTTLGQVPTTTTLTATNINATGATLNGSVNANYLSAVVTFEYGTTTSYGNIATATQSPVTGNTTTNVSANITGLSTATIYHFRVTAINSLGTTYGSDLTFTPDAIPTVTDADGNTYDLITIGTQVWMKENLKTTKYNDATAIPIITDNTQWGSLITGALCWYDNNESSYKSTYGALYNWYAASSGKLCPTGWHTATDAEFATLTSFLGGSSIAGGKMKETGYSHWSSPNTGATNESGFTALPAGSRSSDGVFQNLGTAGWWWTSTPYNSIKSYYWGDSNINTINDHWYGILNQAGFSVRCVKN